MGEGVTARSSERCNQVSDRAAPLVEILDEPVQATVIRLVPFLWNLSCDSPDLLNLNSLRTAECRLERIPVRDVLVNAVSGVDSAQRRVRKTPLARVETIALVDEGSEVSVRALCFSREDCLPPIAIAGPPIKHKDSAKV